MNQISACKLLKKVWKCENNVSQARKHFLKYRHQSYFRTKWLQHADQSNSWKMHKHLVDQSNMKLMILSLISSQEITWSLTLTGSVEQINWVFDDNLWIIFLHKTRWSPNTHLLHCWMGYLPLQFRFLILISPPPPHQECLPYIHPSWNPLTSALSPSSVSPFLIDVTRLIGVAWSICDFSLFSSGFSFSNSSTSSSV